MRFSRALGWGCALAFVIAVVVIVPLVLALPGAARATGAATFSTTETIPVPPASSYAGSGGGDGWAVALTPNAVYNVFHHSPVLSVGCHLQADASPCWSPETITDQNGDNFATSGQPGLWLDQGTGDLYVYATRTSDDTGGVVCIDTTRAATNTDPFCGFTALTAVGDAPTPDGISAISDPVMVGSRWYAFNYVDGSDVAGTQNTLLCFDTASLAPCSSQPFAVPMDSGDVADTDYPPPAVAAIANQVIIPITVGGQDELACFDGANDVNCSGAWPVDLSFSYDSQYGAPFPELSPDGSITGLCLPSPGDPCFDLSGGSVPTPAGMTDAIVPTAGWNGPAFELGPRVYVPDGNENQVDCYDYSANASCANFPLTLSNLGLLYTVNRDAQRPTCIWVNSDNGSSQIQNFDAYTAGACGQGPIRVLASSFVAPGQQCIPSTYTSLQVVSPARNGYSSGTVQFQDADANPLPGVPTDSLDNSGSVDLNGLSLNTGVGLPEFLISLNGPQGTPSSVVIKLTWTGTDDPSCAQAGITVVPQGVTTTTTTTTPMTTTTTTTSNPPNPHNLPSPPPDSAVVFVSGLDSTQAFSDQSSFKRGCTTAGKGGTWATLAGSLVSPLGGRYQVFDAPADNGRSHTADCAGTQTNRGKPADVPAPFHLDTHDDSDETTNGTILLGFLGWLHQNYGINHVWLIGHSYGGIWSRSALTQLAAGDHPILHIDGLITVGTPHTGSFGADLYSTVASTCAEAPFSDAAAISCAAALAVRAHFGNAINGLTHDALTAWNASQTQQTDWGCVPIATMAGTYVDGHAPAGYDTPNDLIVGELSADGDGPGSSITRLIPLLHTSMIHIHVPLINAPVETEDPMVTQIIRQTVLANPGFEARCPGKVTAHTASAAAKRPSYTVTLAGLEELTASVSRLPRMDAGTILLGDATTTVSCGNKPATAEPLLGLSQFRVIFVPRCNQALKVKSARGKHGLAATTRSHASATIVLLGKGKLALTTHGLSTRATTLKLILTRPGKTAMRKLKVGHRTTVRVKPSRYQLQIVARTGNTALVGTIPLRVT